MSVIDLKPQLDAIREAHPEYWRSEAAEAEATALWGGPFGAAETVRIELSGRRHAEIRLAPAPNGRWAMSQSYSHGNGGGGKPITPWMMRYAWASREAALEAGIAQQIERFSRLSRSEQVPSEDRREALRMVAELEALRAQQRQLTLF